MKSKTTLPSYGTKMLGCLKYIADNFGPKPFVFSDMPPQYKLCFAGLSKSRYNVFEVLGKASGSSHAFVYKLRPEILYITGCEQINRIEKMTADLWVDKHKALRTLAHLKSQYSHFDYDEITPVTAFRCQVPIQFTPADRLKVLSVLKTECNMRQDVI